MPSVTIKHLQQNHPGWSALLILLLVTAGAAGLGSIASITATDFYAQLVKPDWAPPAGVFGPVWTVLYLMMALSAWLVVNQAGWQSSRLELTVYFVQLALNALWSWLFFYWHAGAAALLDIALLWLAIVYTVVLFRRVRPGAALLLVPYLLWVSFAAALTWSVYQLNPQLL
jgi:benzodiazapine receptor